MRIALVAPPWNPVPPTKYGGSETMVDNLARGLERAGHDIHLFSLEGSTCPVPKTLIPKGTQPYAFSPVCTETAYVARIIDQLREFDIVHDHTVLGPMFANTLDVPMITTNHAPFMGDINTIYQHMPSTVQVVAISNSQAQLAGFPVPVVHHGVDHEYYQYGDGEGDEQGEYLLFLGRISAIKGVRVAIEVALETNQRLVIAAKMHEPAEHEYFKTDVEPLLTDRVTYIGEVGGMDKVELLRGAKALLNPFVWEEPFGLVMTEALACGTPVITLDYGAAHEIVDDGVTGYVCTNQAELNEAVHNVHQIDRKQCRKSVDDYFNLDRMAADYAEIYREHLAANSGTALIDLAATATASPRSRF